MRTHLSDYADLFAHHVRGFREGPTGEFHGSCPFHDDRQPSFSANCFTGLWKCHGCEAQGNARQFAERVGAVLEENGQGRFMAATYDYTDEHGKLLFQVVRTDPKGCYQRRPDGKGGWIHDLKGVRQVLYRLDALAKAKPKVIYVTKGEKDADRLWSLDLQATCNRGGVGKWRSLFTSGARPGSGWDNALTPMCTSSSLVPQRSAKLQSFGGCFR